VRWVKAAGWTPTDRVPQQQEEMVLGWTALEQGSPGSAQGAEGRIPTERVPREADGRRPTEGAPVRPGGGTEAH